MACTEDFVSYICSQLEGLGVIESKKMFGEYCVYVDGKVFIMACDNIAYVKKNPVLEELLADAECGFPYPGAKEHYIVDVDHRELLRNVAKSVVPVLPYPKSRSKKKA